MEHGKRTNDREKSIYILLTDTGTLFTTMIKRFTAAPYNHASLAFGADLSELYSFGRKKPTNPFAGGFVEEDVYAGTYSHFPNTRCAVLRLRVTERQLEEARLVVESFKRERDQYRYNLVGLLGVLLNRDMGSDKAYFCSQFVAEALSEAGLRLWDRPSSLVTPEHFRKHEALETVYEGLLFDYPLLERGRLGSRVETEEPALEWAVS
ncbi:hypothetical protein [Cohnella sp. JJ-181]|uniref:hypothetical protein n=1 Tax=Cohnella rhizoplanae TaxID=2974897 RepID=UPI0022FF5548|nr:hypothetical protein [Cohnella sp. JJ-181]CAI6014636.1 hypothetical protein COHCIP112018_00020 [Cohnella sp. JJ-181]